MIELLSWFYSWQLRYHRTHTKTSAQTGHGCVFEMTFGRFKLKWKLHDTKEANQSKIITMNHFKSNCKSSSRSCPDPRTDTSLWSPVKWHTPVYTTTSIILVILTNSPRMCLISFHGRVSFHGVLKIPRVWHTHTSFQLTDCTDPYYITTSASCRGHGHTWSLAGHMTNMAVVCTCARNSIASLKAQEPSLLTHPFTPHLYFIVLF